MKQQIIALAVIVCLTTLNGYKITESDDADVNNNEITTTICDNNNNNNDATTQLEHIETDIDINFDPCTDFHNYACGNWRAAYQLRQLGARDTLTALRANNKLLLMQHFHEMSQEESGKETVTTTTTTKTTKTTTAIPKTSTTATTPASHAATLFYNSCMHAEKTEADAIKVYNATLLQLSATWPIISANFDESQTSSPFNWQRVSAQLHRYGVQSLFRLLVQPNWQSADEKIFYLMPPTFEFLQNKVHTAEDSAFLYRRYVKYLMLDLGVRIRKSIQIADEVVSFEEALKALHASTERLVVLRAPQTLAALALEMPDIDLLNYFRTLLQIDEATESIDVAQLLIVADTTYLRKLLEFVRKSKTETIAKFLLVQFLAHFELHLHREDTFNEQREYCMQQLHRFMPMELSTLFVQLQHGDTDAFMQQTQMHLVGIFERLKSQFAQMINETTIFNHDNETKSQGLEKLSAMRLILPNLQQNSLAARQRSKDLLKLIGENYAQNLLNLSLLRTRSLIAEILATPESNSNAKTSPESFSSYSPLNVNAYYRLKRNAIELPVGLLRSPFYDFCMKPAQIYGSLVYIIAHELLHGFDYDGRNYDKSGNVSNNWGTKSIIRFGTKSSCYLTERYENAALAINENIADSEGLRLSLETYLHSKDKEVEGSTDPAAPTNKDLKLFFISFAQTWCGSAAASATTSSTNSSSDGSDVTMQSLHAAHSERVNNVVGNFPEFAEIFKCRKDSLMNPTEKCRIW